MRIYATQDVEGTLAALPDPRLSPNPFAVTADSRARTLGEQLDAFLQATGLAPSNGLAVAQASAQVTPQPKPILQQPVVLLALGFGLGYLLLKVR